MSDTTSVLSYVAIAFSAASTIYAAVNRHRIRSTCCGFKGEASLDIGELTPEHPPGAKTILSSLPPDAATRDPNLPAKPDDSK